MTEQTSNHPSLAETEDADLLEYGAISPMAVGSLFLGLASALAMANLLLLVLPLIGLFTSLLALRQIALSEGALVGRKVALSGLALALLFAAMAIGGTVTRYRVLVGEGRSFAEDWLQLVREGDLQRAHQLHLAPDARQLPSSSLTQYYTVNETAGDELATFFAQSPLKEVASSTGAKITLLTSETARYGKKEHVVLHYRIEPTGTAPLTEFVVIVERSPTDAGGIWRTMLVSEPKSH